MKNHHLFLLIVSLLLAASFIFPTDYSLSSSTPPLHTVPTEHCIYLVNDVDDIPSKVLVGDILKIATTTKELSTSSTISNLQLLSQDPVTKVTKNILEGENLPVENILAEHDESPQKYTVIHMPTKPGKYRLTYKSTPTFGNYKIPNPETRANTFVDIEAFPQTAANIETITINGDNGK